MTDRPSFGPFRADHPVVMIDRRAVHPVGSWGARTLVAVTCPWCEGVHVHHWRATDEHPGWKDPSCTERGTGRYWVPAPPAPTSADLTYQIEQARTSLDEMEYATARDGAVADLNPRDLLAVVLACAALVAAVDRIIEQ